MAEQSLSINRWADDDRPRERLAKYGPSKLSDAELLAILIGSGSPGQSAVALMRQVLADCGNNLNTLGKMSIGQLTDARYKGLGPAKAITILAACELGKRRQMADVEERVCLNSSQAIYGLMRPALQDSDVEEAWVLLLNHAYKLIRKINISHGGFTETAVDIRLIIKHALLNNATVLALCHNHPSGNPRPSREDDNITKMLSDACRTMRIHLVDHLVITDGSYYSYRDEGRIG